MKKLLIPTILTLFIFSFSIFAANMEPNPVAGHVKYIDGSPAKDIPVTIHNLNCLDERSYRPTGHSEETRTDSGGTFSMEMSNFPCLIFSGQRVTVSALGMQRTVESISGVTWVDLISGETYDDITGEVTLPDVEAPPEWDFTVTGRVRFFKGYYFSEQDVSILNLRTSIISQGITDDGYYRLVAVVEEGDSIEVKVCEGSDECIKTITVSARETIEVVDFNITDEKVVITWYGATLLVFILITKRWWKGFQKGILKYWKKLFPSRARKMARTVARKHRR